MAARTEDICSKQQSVAGRYMYLLGASEVAFVVGWRSQSIHGIKFDQMYVQLPTYSDGEFASSKSQVRGGLIS